MIRQLFHHVAVLRRGRIVEHGPVGQVTGQSSLLSDIAQM
jgi:ABC-type microcin C transport system duplicated ATPase subunit YejF